MPGETPPRPDADRNLLFGILALQMDFINRDALIAAMNAWVLDKKKPLSQILLDQGAYRPEDGQLLEVVIKRHLELHHHDVAKSLAALSSIDSVRDDLERIADPEVRVSLAQLPTPLLPKEDAYATRAASVGPPSSTGLRFRILRPHAKGGLGAVFVAHDQELHRDVALKEIQDRHADKPESRARFLQEAEITGGLEHPGIVPVYGLGQYADGRPFYAMRFIRGESLYDAIHAFHEADKTKRDPGERALALRHLLGQFIAACNAIGYAHARGVLHRDLKPDNIMLGKYGETLVVDWGLAKPVGSPDGPTAVEEGLLRPSSAGSVTPTQAGSVMGTPAYMSPEQAVGKLDQLRPASDVYSLGATLYALLTGVAPFRGTDIFEVLVKVRQGRFQPPREVNSNVPPALEAICVKAMALQPESRYPTAQALAADVEHWLADEPVEAYREPFSARLWRWARRHKPVVASVAVLLVSAVAALAVSNALIARERENTRHQRDLALEQEREARRYWYVGDMNLAQQAWEGADVDRVLRLLKRQRPVHEDLRSFEWYYLWRLCHGARFTLRGHQSVVHAVAVSPDGRTIASGSGNRDRTVKLWDAATGRELATLQGHTHAILSVAYTSDGPTLATGDEGGQVKLWNPATRQERRSFRAYAVGVMAMAFTPDGKTLATAGGDGKIKLWDTATGAEPVVFGGHKGRAWSIAFSPDGRMLASAGDDRTVVIWDAATGKELAAARGHNDWIHSVAFAPDGKTIASGSRDGTVRIWDVVKLDVVKVYGESFFDRPQRAGHVRSVCSRW